MTKPAQSIPIELNPTNLPQFDSTMLSDFRNCQRYFYWRHIRQYESIDIKLPLVYGIAIHAMLAEWYRTHDLRSALAAFDQSWIKHGEPEGDQKRNPQRAAELMNAYRNFYPQEPFKVVDIEVRGALPLDEIMLVVIIDLVADYPGYGLLPMDHKTTSYFNDKWWRGKTLRWQYSAYLWTMRQLFGKNCNSLYVNGILVDKSRCLFERQPTSRNDWELEQWVRQVKHLYKEIQLCKEMDEWPQQEDYCDRWPETCQFHPLCTQVGVDYRKIEPGGSYKKSVWDPLNEVR